jgi:ADP-ribose pyrophosphatase YjhB (NUDIX family)
MKQVVRVFLSNENWKILLTKHKWKDIWVLPWWHIENNESIFKCAKRELKEEFNLDIKIIWNKIWLQSEKILKEYPSPICSYKIEYETKKRWLQKRLEYIFLAEITNNLQEIKIQESEIWEYKFFSLDEIIELKDTFQQIKEIAKYLLKNA